MAEKSAHKRSRGMRKGRSELEQVEQTLKESEQLFRTLAQSSFAGTYVIQDGTFRSINHSAASHAGYQVEELIGRRSEALVYHEDLEGVRANVRAMLRGERTAPYEFRIVTKSGETRWVMETVTSISYEGRPAILGNSMNIGDHKLAQEALRESEQRLADTIDFLPDATFAIDRAGKVIIWNRAIEEMTGVKAGDMLGKGDYEYAIPFYGRRRPILVDLALTPDRRLEEYYSYVKRENGRLVAETDLLSLKSKDVFLWGKASPLWDSKGNVVGAMESIRDITERKQAELALKKRELDLEAKTCELEDLNAALRVLLKQRDEDRKVLEEKVLTNIKLLILPHIDKLKGKVDAECKSFIKVLESNLKDIVSPFAHRLSVQVLNLTNREVQIANLIKEGMSTKEIAGFLHISEAAVNIHRFRIRQKLNLTKTQNLRSYLSSLS